MNERIRELAEQAGIVFWEISGDVDWRQANRENLEKFAELIIRECAQVAAQTPCPYEDEFAKQTYGHTWDMACVEAAKNIKKHFGVKE